MTPLRWLALANGAWFVAGAIAYYTTASIMIGTLVALVAMLPGLNGWDNVWADRARSFATGTWAVLAMMIIIPYAATENGVSLWSVKAYSVTGMVIASLGIGLANVCAAMATGLGKRIRGYAAAHLVLLAVGLYWAAGDAGTTMLSLGGNTFTAIDLSTAPAVAAAAGAMWALAFFLAEREPDSPDSPGL